MTRLNLAFGAFEEGIKFDVLTGRSSPLGGYHTTRGHRIQLEFLDPYYPTRVRLPEGTHQWFPSAMHAYIASRTDNEGIRSRLRECLHRSSLETYRNQLIPNRVDWESCRRQLLYQLLVQKYTRSYHMANLLLDTAPSTIFYTFLGALTTDDVCVGVSADGKTGDNLLGFLTVEIRGRLQQGELSPEQPLLSLPPTPTKPLSVPERVGVLLKDPTIGLTGKLPQHEPSFWDEYCGGW